MQTVKENRNYLATMYAKHRSKSIRCCCFVVYVKCFFYHKMTIIIVTSFIGHIVVQIDQRSICFRLTCNYRITQYRSPEHRKPSDHVHDAGFKTFRFSPLPSNLCWTEMNKHIHAKDNKNREEIIKYSYLHIYIYYYTCKLVLYIADLEFLDLSLFYLKLRSKNLKVQLTQFLFFFPIFYLFVWKVTKKNQNEKTQPKKSGENRVNRKHTNRLFTHWWCSNFVSWFFYHGIYFLKFDCYNFSWLRAIIFFAFRWIKAWNALGFARFSKPQLISDDRQFCWLDCFLSFNRLQLQEHMQTKHKNRRNGCRRVFHTCIMRILNCLLHFESPAVGV